MSADYIWTVACWSLAAVAFFGSGSWIVWEAFAPPVEDEEAVR